MSQYKGRTGLTYVCGKRLGGGGEGDVYEIAGQPHLVAKIYKDAKFHGSCTREYMKEKLETMLDQSVQQDAGCDPCVAWPTDILLDGNRLVGYTMPLLEGYKPIYCASREYERKQLFPNYTWKTAVAVAYNLALAVKLVHDAGAVVSDMNPNNIMVNEHGHVTLIDTDSFTITNKKTGKVFKCTVGVPNMLPPELQGKDLSKESSHFTRETDCFSLAIHIFNLIANNCHPFSCVNPSAYQQSTSKNTIVHNITKGVCPYVTGSRDEKNPTAPDMAMFPQKIRNLIDRAFSYTAADAVKKATISKRPSAEEWWLALHELYTGGMNSCPSDHSHVFPKHYKTCPWCDANARAAAVNNQITNTGSSSGWAHTGRTSSNTNTSGGSWFNGTGSTGAGTAVRPANHPGNTGTSAMPRRSEWLLWAVCIICGLITGPIFAEYAAAILNAELDLGIPYDVCLIAMMIIGGINGCIVSYLARDAYIHAYNGWPWLLLGLTVPVATIVCTALVALAIALILGIISVILTIIGIILVLGFCSGG